MLEDVDAHLLVPEIEVGVVGKVVAGVDGGSSAYGIGGEGVLVEDRRRGAMEELCESEVELMAGSVWAEEVWRAGAMVSSSSPACGQTAAVNWGFGAGMWRTSEGNALRGLS